MGQEKSPEDSLLRPAERGRDAAQHAACWISVYLGPEEVYRLSFFFAVRLACCPVDYKFKLSQEGSFIWSRPVRKPQAQTVIQKLSSLAAREP